jgi:hypothetical protein
MPSSVNRKKLRIVDPNARRRSAPIFSNVQTGDAFRLTRQKIFAIFNKQKARDSLTRQKAFAVPLSNVVDAQIND